MKLGSVTKLDNRNRRTSKKFDVDFMKKILTSLSQNLAYLGQSGGRILDTESAKVIFSVKITFVFTKTGIRTKKSLTQLSHYCFE